MNEMMVPTYLHVPICCFVLCCFPRCGHSFSPFFLLPHFPHFSLLFSMLHMSFLFGGYSIFPLFLLPHFSHFSLFLVFYVFFFFDYYVSDFPRWFPNDQWFFNCVKASLFVFSVRGGDLI